MSCSISEVVLTLGWKLGQREKEKHKEKES